MYTPSPGSQSYRDQALAAYNAGQRDQARGLFYQAVQTNPADDVSWTWIAHLAASPAEQQQALERAVAINPGNMQAQSVLATLRAQAAYGAGPSFGGQGQYGQPGYGQPGYGVPYAASIDTRSRPGCMTLLAVLSLLVSVPLGFLVGALVLNPEVQGESLREALTHSAMEAGMPSGLLLGLIVMFFVLFLTSGIGLLRASPLGWWSATMISSFVFVANAGQVLTLLIVLGDLITPYEAGQASARPILFMLIALGGLVALYRATTLGYYRISRDQKTISFFVCFGLSAVVTYLVISSQLRELGL